MKKPVSIFILTRENLSPAGIIWMENGSIWMEPVSDGSEKEEWAMSSWKASLKQGC